MTEQQPTLEELNAQIAVASANGDIPTVIALGKQMLKFKADVEKAEAEKLRVEAETLSAQREEMEKTLYGAVKAAVKDFDIAGLKAKGFTFVASHTENDKGQLDPTGSVKVTGAVKLMVPAIKAKGGGGGGTTGLLKQSTGLSRHELIDQYATAEEKAAAQKAYDEATSRPDSARYNAEKPIIKRIIANNPHLVKS